MAQVIINTGNVANDGLGTPLRNAFDQVNYNFTQLFNAGPSGSNIVIANNSITVTNTNGNLRLATNGIGSIVPAANFVPDVPNIRSIGAGTNRFNTVYAQYINANTGTFAGNVYVAGNLEVTGNVVTVNYSNLSVANSNITLATGAANAAQANGGGLLIPIARANLTYNYSANSWNSTIAITAPTFIGDGSNLTNVIANVQANALLGNTFSNTVNYSNLTSFGLVSALSATGNLSTTGNVYANAIVGNRITANYLAGNGSNITNITANAIVGNVPFAVNAGSAYTANLAALATQAINADTALFAINANLAAWANTATIAQTANAATYAVQADNANSAVVAGMAYELSPAANLSIAGNITTGGYFIGDGGLLSNVVVTTSYGNSNVVTLLGAFGSNTINTTGAISVGDVTLTNIYSPNYFANAIAFANANGYITTSSLFKYNPGTEVITVGAVSATGNITANYFIGNGSQLTGLAATYGNSNVAAYLPTYTGNVSANYFIGDGSLLTGLPATYGNSNVADYLSSGSVTTDYLTSGNISASGNVSGGYAFFSDIQLNDLSANAILYTDANRNVFNTDFSYNPDTQTMSGANISLTGNVTANYFIGDGSQLTGLAATYGNSNVESYLQNLSTDVSTSGNVTAANFVTSGVQGNITGANVISAITFVGDGSQLSNISINTIFNGTSNVSVPTANSNINITTGGTNTWNFDNTGMLTLPGGGIITSALGSPQQGLWLGFNGHRLLLNNDGQFWTGGIELGGNGLPGYIGSYGNITLNANIGNSPNDSKWIFGADGNMTAPGNINVSGNISSSGNVYAGNLTARLSNGNSAINIANNGNVNVGIGPFSTTILNIAGTGISVFGNISTNGYVSATGNVTANIFVGNGSGLTNVAQQTRGSWSVVAGTNTYSFTVPAGTWQMWVTGNIPNGIIAWNATATVTNTNVPVVGQQYAWVYDGAGSPIDFVSIPNQFVGTANSIVRSNVAPSSNTNTFTFSINNTSGNTQTVYYGYTAL